MHTYILIIILLLHQLLRSSSCVRVSFGEFLRQRSLFVRATARLRFCPLLCGSRGSAESAGKKRIIRRGILRQGAMERRIGLLHSA